MILDYSEEYFEGGKGYYAYNDDPRFQVDAQFIVDTFQPTSVLELGCAKGFLVKALRDRGIKAYGVDTSEYAISHAPEEIQDFVWQYDATSNKRMEFPKVDLIVSFDFFEHIPEELLDNVWYFMERHGKQFYSKVGTLDTPDWDHDATHITMHTLDWWELRYPEVNWEESK